MKFSPTTSDSVWINEVSIFYFNRLYHMPKSIRTEAAETMDSDVSFEMGFISVSVWETGEIRSTRV